MLRRKLVEAFKKILLLLLIRVIRWLKWVNINWAILKPTTCWDWKLIPIYLNLFQMVIFLQFKDIMIALFDLLWWLVIFSIKKYLISHQFVKTKKLERKTSKLYTMSIRGITTFPFRSFFYLGPLDIQPPSRYSHFFLQPKHL